MATCKDCLHNDACVDMLQALGFTVDGDGYLADRRCSTFKDKSRYVEVVRCKDCKHYMLWEDSDDKRSCTKAIWLMVSDPDDFCSYGERREGE